MPLIKIAIAGVGNCASSLVQGLAFYADNPDAPGLLHPTLGNYSLSDIRVVAAFDIDVRKVGQPLERAIFALPNNTKVFQSDVPVSNVIVQMAPVLDGVAGHMEDYPESQRFIPADEPAVDVAAALKKSGADILINYLPVGSQQATEYFAKAALSASCAFINCIPVFIASDVKWAERFRAAGLPIIGDDIKAQLGATITHRTLARLFASRGLKIDSTYQLNTGGNTDFLNMLQRSRLAQKKISKTEAVQSQLDVPLEPEQIHIGPSDYVPFLKDNKIAYLRIEATGFGGVPMNLELRLSVEDSPNSAGVVVDAIRCARIALDRKIGGPIEAVSAWTMKHPPKQMTDVEAGAEVDRFANGY